ncbi:MAG TPA: acetolactate synthase large subunit [Beijerinckiaceae bacterium]
MQDQENGATGAQDVRNGAESMLATLVASGVDVCFANPGTSEMHFVAALDRFDDMRCILALHETVAVGCADGFARMADRPAATMLHLGPGLANGVSNLHNARRAGTPIVNLIGEHASWHRELDAPLNSDIAGLAAPFSDWVRVSAGAGALAQDTADAVAAARGAPGAVASLIIPADAAWGPAKAAAKAPAARAPSRVAADEVERVARLLRGGEPTALLVSGAALRARLAETLARIAAATGVKVFAQAFNARMERGAGRAVVESLPFVTDQAVEALAPYRRLVLVGAKAPVAFFAHPAKPSVLTHPDCVIDAFAGPEHDLAAALEDLASAVGARPNVAAREGARPEPPMGAITPQSLGMAIAAAIPDDAVVVDESITSGRALVALTATARPHDLLQNLGGSIGVGMPLATGAAIAQPGRKVLCLESDGSGLYAPQALWTQARENLDVVTLVFSNRAYGVLKHELRNMGAGNGRRSTNVLELDRPAIDWTALARGFGVPARRVDTIEGVYEALRDALRAGGPALVEAVF